MKSNSQKTISPIFDKLKVVSNSLNQKDMNSVNSDLLLESLDQDSKFSNQNMIEKNPNHEPLLNGYSKIQELKLVKIGLASSDRIREWAEKQLPNNKVFGEVLNANTLHYKTFKPHKGGLFCERIFGPLKDFECACGIKQKPNEHEVVIQNLLDSKKNKRHFCPNCDVEYTWSVIRRYQLGYIQLISPVTHLWYLRTNPSYLSLLLDLRKRELESIIYCMQITTLEYYWKPMHSLQMNLTPASLFESYKKYLKFSSLESKEAKEFTIRDKKKQNRLKKQKDLTVIRYENQLTPTTQTPMQFLANASLKSQIDYLEKSFQLTSPPTSLVKTSEITSFLKQKLSKTVKKRSFVMVQKKLSKTFYKETYETLAQRTFLTKTKFAKKNFETFYKEMNSNELFNVPFQNETDGNKRNLLNSFVETSVLAHELEKNLMKSTENKFIERDPSLFLTKFVKLVDQNGRKKAWKPILQTKKQLIKVISEQKMKKMYPNFSIDLNQFSLMDFVESFLLLYLLIIIEKNSHSFVKKETEELQKENIIVKSFLKADLQNFIKNKKIKFANPRKNIPVKNLEFVSNFLQTNFLIHTNTENVQFYEFQRTFGKKENSMKFFNPLVNKVTEMFFTGSHQIYNEVSNQSYLGNVLSNTYKTSIGFGNFINLNKSNGLNQNKSDSGIDDVLFKELTNQKKVTQFVKNTSAYASTLEIYQKNNRNLSRNLRKVKQSPFLKSSPMMVNNIYTVSYSAGWESERDWKYFLYYNTSPIELSDKLISYYKYRFVSTFSSTSTSSVPIIGANLIEKLLLEYEGFELKKMAIHYQNILPKLNRYIRSEKQLASNKSDFLRIQKLLQKRDLIIRRLKLLRKIFKKNTKASSMVLKTLPVLPPDLRPILKMQNQIAASDLNRFYQRILYRNDRLKKFLRMNTSILNSEPGFEIKYAQRLLQESVDNLIQNGKGQVKPETNSRGQPLKSLSEILKGKQGRFRQYLLGKRVDYSGRSVIVVGPTLKIYECGLPFEMAMELFLPFLIKRIFQYNYARTVIGAKTLLQTQKELTWQLLEEVMKNHPILLNRAPTLHRLGIQAFQPKLIEGRAILLHPLVCPAFNADFDGDQMAVHVPITVEARTEAWKLMLSRNHLISPATGEPMLLPSQDMVLGCYYLTTEVSQYPRFHGGRPFISGTSFYFLNLKQVLQAYLQERIHLQTPIWIRWNGALQMETQSSQPYEIRIENSGTWVELRPKTHRTVDRSNSLVNLFIRTTAGRVLFNTLINNCLQSP